MNLNLASIGILRNKFYGLLHTAEVFVVVAVPNSGYHSDIS